MADTLQAVHWSLGADAHAQGDLWLPPGHEDPAQVLLDAIDRLGLEARLRSEFERTEPLWYGLWIDSPLTTSQCRLLHAVFLDVVRAVPRYEQYLREFLGALASAIDTGEPLSVVLAPPGHVDLGWVTTFVHCPRCKAEGPFDRWQESYPAQPINCPVCGHRYAPGETYSSVEEVLTQTVRCTACHATFPADCFSASDLKRLQDHQWYRECCEELQWLRRVEAFYERYPELEDEIQPHFLDILKSDDPKILADVFAGVPFREMTVAPETLIENTRTWAPDELEVIDYLRHSSFALEPRLQFINESIEKLKAAVQAGAPKCPGCGGALELSDLDEASLSPGP